MDVTSVLRDELFKPAVTLLGPGAIAVTPYLIYFSAPSSHIHKLLSSHAGITAVTVVFIFVVVGLLMDNLGARVEIFFDKKLSSTDGYTDHDENWKKFWRVAYKDEPVGHRYLRTIVLKLKFELNTLSSLPFFFLGLPLVAYVDIVTVAECVILLLGSMFLFVFLIFEIELTVKLLSDIRKELLKGIINLEKI
ncbi:MAG: hypothetical protein OEZ43_19110 [Gammaproteobacteria bacterium]|nr:hypothetical protein [Gammaproteobacteria bacterium]